MQLFRSVVLLIAFCTGIATSYAQLTRIDSLTQKLKKDSARLYRFKKVQVLLSFDKRNTFLGTAASANSPVYMRGIKIGVTLYERHRTGIGSYGVDRSRRHVTYVDGRRVDLDFNFDYLTVFYEYYFIHSRLWDIGIPFELGLGRYSTHDSLAERRGAVVPMGTAIDVHLKPMRWFTLNTMGGYRVVGNNNSGVKLNNWFYSFGISLKTRHIYEDTRYYLKKRKYHREVSRLQE